MQDQPSGTCAVVGRADGCGRRCHRVSLAGLIHAPPPRSTTATGRCSGCSWLAPSRDSAWAAVVVKWTTRRPADRHRDQRRRGVGVVPVAPTGIPFIDALRNAEAVAGQDLAGAIYAAASVDHDRRAGPSGGPAHASTAVVGLGRRRGAALGDAADRRWTHARHRGSCSCRHGCRSLARGHGRGRVSHSHDSSSSDGTPILQPTMRRRHDADVDRPQSRRG